MIIKIIKTTCFVMIIATSVKAQDNIENVLSEITKNNKSIIANQQFGEAKKLQFKTGLTLDNPSIEFEYLLGTPAGAGNQTDLYIGQSFDFPTAYGKKKQVANEKIVQIEFEQARQKQNILFQAKQYCIELIYLNKRQGELESRLQRAEKLYTSYKTKLSSGSANSLEINKVKLQLLNLQNDSRLNTSQIGQISQKLNGFNGGIPIVFRDTVYESQLTVLELDALIKAIEASNPALKSLQQEQEINLKQVELTKALSLPKMEAGYRSQAILGQNYQGVHFGITIPLWENKNKVKFQQAQVLFSEVKISEYKNLKNSEIKQLYEKYLNLKTTLEEYQQLLTGINNVELLDKALKLGEISSIQYFMEINYFHNSYDRYLQLEMDYHQVVTELNKYQL